jgi:hypothetical protein
MRGQDQQERSTKSSYCVTIRAKNPSRRLHQPCHDRSHRPVCVIAHAVTAPLHSRAKSPETFNREGTNMTSQQPAPGWYPNPSGGAGQMYWDGQQWRSGAPTPPPGYGAAAAGQGIRIPTQSPPPPPQGWVPPAPQTQGAGAQTASEGLANVKTFAARLPVLGWLLYGGFVLAAIALFLPWVSVNSNLSERALDVSPFKGFWVFALLALIAAAGFLAWPAVSRSQMPPNRLIGLSVAIGLLALGVVRGVWAYADGVSEFVKNNGGNDTDVEEIRSVATTSLEPGMILYMVAVVAMVAGVVLLWRQRSQVPKRAY